MNATILAQTLNAIQAIINWLAARGVSRDRVQNILNNANALGVDITTEVAQAELDVTATELDETGDLIDETQGNN